MNMNTDFLTREYVCQTRKYVRPEILTASFVAEGGFASSGGGESDGNGKITIGDYTYGGEF